MTAMTGAINLGTFGTPRANVAYEFNYFGETIRVAENASDLGMIEYLEQAMNIDIGDVDLNDEAAVADRINNAAPAVQAVTGQLREIIHPDDWDRFWATAKKNGQMTVDVMALGQQLVSAVAGFPTRGLSDSSGGPSNTPPNSEDDSSSPAPRRRSRTGQPAAFRESPADRDTRRALEQLKGRPDLKQLVVDAARARREEEERSA